jgi:hypothetical protein
VILNALRALHDRFTIPSIRKIKHAAGTTDCSNVPAAPAWAAPSVQLGVASSHENSGTR